MGDDLKSMKEQLRRIPRGGIDYGLLRYLCRDEEVVRQMSGLPRAEVSFNYLGQFDQTFQTSGLFQLARESSGAARDQNAQRGNLLGKSMPASSVVACRPNGHTARRFTTT